MHGLALGLGVGINTTEPPASGTDTTHDRISEAGETRISEAGETRVEE